MSVNRASLALQRWHSSSNHSKVKTRDRGAMIKVEESCVFQRRAKGPMVCMCVNQGRWLFFCLKIQRFKRTSLWRTEHTIGPASLAECTACGWVCTSD
jgi:hypothetical protein